MMLDKLDSPDKINKFFTNWHDIPEGQRLQIIRDLKASGSLRAITTTQTSEKLFRCPIYSFELVKPCNLESCQYHISALQSRNCLVNCLSESRNGRLSPNEISEVLGLTTVEVNKLSSQSFRKIQKALIKENLEDLSTPVFHINKHHCVNCEQHIKDELEFGATPELAINGDYGWCSLSCKKVYPEWRFFLEKEFRRNYLEVVTEAFRELKKHSDVDELLELPNGTTKSLLKN